MTELWNYENNCWEAGYETVCGVDEGGINSKLATEIHQTENRPGTHCITVDRSSYRIVMLQKNVSMFSKTNDVVFRITKAKS